MAGPDAAVAAVRQAVRAVLPDDGVVLVACSGGADSLALLAAAIFEAHSPKGGTPRVIGVVVDHGLQDDSAAHTDRVVAQMAAMGADETASIRVTVDAADGGLEAAARDARYAALGQLAEHFTAETVLLGHTRDDQAETVLLGLVRGSGGRSIAGMRPDFIEDGVWFVRPLLGIGRAQTEAACRAEGLDFWSDPHNADPRFVRSRLRHTVLPMLEEQLGPGVIAALARTAASVRADVDALDNDADHWVATHDQLAVNELATLAPATRTRVLRRAALAAGALGGELSSEHIAAMDALITAWRGQAWVDLPGHVRALRRDGRLVMEPAPDAVR